MFYEKNRQQRNSVLSFLITLLILLLLVLGIWLTEQVAHWYKAADADAEVDVEDVSEPDNLKIAARRPRNRAADMAPAKNTIAHHDAVEPSLREENKKPEQEKAQMPIPKSPSEPPLNPENEQGNVET